MLRIFRIFIENSPIEDDSEFSLWLRQLPIQVLRRLIRHHDFDAQRRTAKWKEQEKLVEFIIERIQSRIERGSAFLTIQKINEDPE